MGERFSQRMGITPKTTSLQLDWMNDDLRVGLWNVFYELRGRLSRDGEWALGNRIWGELLKKPLDEAVGMAPFQVLDEIKATFFQASWWWVYEFVEFVHDRLPLGMARDATTVTNEVLEREGSGYRLIKGMVVPITAPEELEAVAAACDGLGRARAHIVRAGELLGYRPEPDYRNSIKESISAVEAACCMIAGKPKATLGQALKVIEGRGVTHPSLKGGFDKLYGWTSDDQGIRHALLDEPTLDFADSKFMLVACSAFVNYLQAKSA
jgi:hypothetical protein